SSARSHAPRPWSSSCPSLSPSLVAERRPFVGVDSHEVREARDLEDLAVMIGEASGTDRAMLLPRARETADDQRDPRARQDVHASEVEDDRLRVALRG